MFPYSFICVYYGYSKPDRCTAHRTHLRQHGGFFTRSAFCIHFTCFMFTSCSYGEVIEAKENRNTIVIVHIVIVSSKKNLNIHMCSHIQLLQMVSQTLQLKGDRKQEERERETAMGQQVGLNPRVLQWGQSLCTWGAQSTN